MVIRAHSNLGADHIRSVTEQVKKYNVGGLCFFQGGPVRQANLTNYYQQMAQTPLFIAIDGEWGLGMRLDSVINFPRQLMIGAVPDAALVYRFGRAVGEQCRRLGIHINFAPVVDVNNNPNNPVINDRSFGEDKYKVGLYGIQYMKGMQDVGVMACAKHFPGHGDTETDSHYDLPVISKSRPQLDSLELYPFRGMFREGVGSVMIAHLYIPSIDNTKNLATSLSYNNVTKLMREEMGYNGLTFTDALEMQGVKKFFPDGEASVQSLIAGNDVLCLPGDVPAAIRKIKEAIKKKRLYWDGINARVKKVLMAKYQYGLSQPRPVDTRNITADLNAATNDIKTALARQAITLLSRQDAAFFPLTRNSGKRIAYVGLGLTADNAITKRMRADYKADVFFFHYKSGMERIPSLMNILQQRYDLVVIGLHNYSRRPAGNFGIGNSAVNFIRQMQGKLKTITLTFGNPYAIKNFCDAPNLMACYEDDEITQLTAADMLQGSIPAVGKLPVTVCDRFQFGSGLVTRLLPAAEPAELGLNAAKLQVIDSLAAFAIGQGAAPGCVVLVARHGKIAYHRAFGSFSYDGKEPVSTEAIYDLASVTKVCATTISVMKLYEEGKLDLKKKLGDYLHWVKGTDKENLVIEDILLHQAGLKAWIPFYKETIGAGGIPNEQLYRRHPDEQYAVRVADSLFMRKDWRDTMYKRMLQSPLEPRGRYVYSDNDFIFLGKIVEALSGMPLQTYVQETFYAPLGMTSTGFLPRDRFPLHSIAPTENEKIFRLQTLRGDVHDPGAAMFGGVAGHAGLFSNAYDLAILLQMLLNGGTFNGRQFLKAETIRLFTSYGSAVSRRGLGFDKPEKDNAGRPEPYPASSVSPETYGHTGFTGTCVWVDPRSQLVFVFLSNRVHPAGGDNQKLLRLNIRGSIQEAVYKAIL